MGATHNAAVGSLSGSWVSSRLMDQILISLTPTISLERRLRP
jgi:hypothetical protein